MIDTNYLLETAEKAFNKSTSMSTDQRTAIAVQGANYALLLAMVHELRNLREAVERKSSF